MDDDPGGKAVSVIVSFWISMRRLEQSATRAFGKAGRRALPPSWCRSDVSDRALDLTADRAAKSKLVITGNTAELKVRWLEEDDSEFKFAQEPIYFRRVGGCWKIDANRMTGLARGVDFFEEGSWGPMFRDQVEIMNQAAERADAGRFKNARQLNEFIDQRLERMIRKYDTMAKEGR